MGHYVYYSFEEGGGRGYIGVRHKDPGGDGGYLGSFHDPTFKPSRKIIIREYDTAEEAIRGEIALHALFNVKAASHFANRANQTHRGFSTAGATCWKNELTQKSSICFIKPEGEGWERGVLQKSVNKVREAISGENHPQYGVPRTEEWKKAHSEKMSGRYIGALSPCSKPIIAITPDGEEVFFEGRNQAARELRIDPHTLRDYLNKGEVLSKKSKYPGWQFRYV